MAVVTLHVTKPRAALVIEATGQLCEARHPDGHVCEGAGNHRGPHNYGLRVGSHGTSWPNERVHHLPY
jgi:hypothetical protein